MLPLHPLEEVGGVEAERPVVVGDLGGKASGVKRGSNLPFVRNETQNRVRQSPDLAGSDPHRRTEDGFPRSENSMRPLGTSAHSPPSSTKEEPDIGAFSASLEVARGMWDIAA